MSADRTTRPKKAKAPRPKKAAKPKAKPLVGLPPGAVDLDALPTPPLVLEMLERLNPKKKARGYWEDEYKLSYYYGGKYVAADLADGRFIVLAAADEGSGDLRAALDKLPPQPGRRVVILIPERIDAHLEDLVHRPRPTSG
jgi:hypothetical protein